MTECVSLKTRPAPPAPDGLPATATPAQAPATAPRVRRLAVGLIGPGHVGSALMAQLREARPRLLRDKHLDLSLCLVADSRHMWLDCDDGQLNQRRRGAQTWRPADLLQAADYLRQAPHALMIDCSASETVTERYADWLAAGLHVATPNKLALSGPLARVHAIRVAAASGRAQLRCEGTVGAGLPVVDTLRQLLDTGDRLVSVSGMFSGSLAWLFNNFDGSRPFSALLREARQRGYTEPDPRADLSGLDVARKLVILAREAGHTLSLADVDIDNLVPEAQRQGDADSLLDNPAELDAAMAARLAEAQAGGGVLRHVGELDSDGHARVGVRILPAAHGFAHTRATDNIVQFHTTRYHDNPLVVQGPGAGPDVTAAGVFGDVLRIAATLPEAA